MWERLLKITILSLLTPSIKFKKNLPVFGILLTSLQSIKPLNIIDMMLKDKTMKKKTREYLQCTPYL
jgi:hypothetical protein